jgi:hypothetical protein
MAERIVLSELKKAKETTEKPGGRERKPGVSQADARLWARRIGGLVLGCGVAALIYKLAHAQSASAFVWLRNPYDPHIDLKALRHMVTVYNAAFFFGALAGGVLARGRILFSVGLALLIVLAVAIPYRAHEVSGGLGPAQYLEPDDTEGLRLIYRASHLVQLVEMAGGFVMAALGANLGSRLSRWIVKEKAPLDL